MNRQNQDLDKLKVWFILQLGSNVACDVLITLSIIAIVRSLFAAFYLSGG